VQRRPLNALPGPFTRSLLVVALLAISSTGYAKECWFDDPPPKRSISDPRGRTEYDALERVARELNGVFHRSASLNKVLESTEPARLRSRWSVALSSTSNVRSSLWMQVREHRKEMWLDSCSFSKNAERIEPRASIVVHVDAPDALLERRVLYDDQLTAWAQPPITGFSGSRPIYFGWLVVLTADGRVPWEPVSMEEYLQFHKRELERADATTKKTSEQVRRQDDVTLDKQAVLVYENMRKFDPAAAEKMLADLRAQLPAAKDQARRNAANSERQATTALAALEAFRTSLPVAVLKGQARMGWTEPLEQSQVERLPLLVKVRKDWAAAGNEERAPYRPRLIGLIIQGKGPFSGLMQDVLQELDYGAIQALVQPSQAK